MILLMLACSAPPSPEGATIAMDFAGPGFYDAPFPSDHRRGVAGFPNPDGIAFVEEILGQVGGDFGTTSGIFLRTTAPLAPLPEGIAADGAVRLLSVDPPVRSWPITVQFEEDAGPFGGPNLLSVLPLQGVPLAPRSRYAVVVTGEVLDAKGQPLVPSEAMRALAVGARPSGLSEEAFATYRDALAAVGMVGVSPYRVAGMAAFTTGDPTAELATRIADARDHLPEPPATWTERETFDDFCVREARVAMPVYQQGDPPYLDEGGGMGASPVRFEEARIVVTLPRHDMPEGGWPTAVMIRTGGGGDRPLVDRGVRDAAGEVAVPGTGPALHFARAGFAGVSVDGPLGGIRNTTGGDEQFLIFNVGNPVAMRDNLRQSALELALLPDLLAEVAVPGCEAGEETFDTSALALMGHSMGATIAPLVVANEPRYGALILSGAGGSWIENVVHKQSPLAVRPIAEAMVGYDDHELDPHDPVLSMLQWAGEPADPPVYGAAVEADVLMLQGIVDTYILPPIANATSLSLGLDLGGEPLDEGLGYVPVLDVLPWVGRGAVSLPASHNAEGRTRVVVQHPEDGVEDGHEVVFQTGAPKAQYTHFLRTWWEGNAEIPR